MQDPARPGLARATHDGWLAAHKWLLLRRFTQAGILGLFLLGPLTGIWVVKGNLASSLTLETLPLTDPYVLLQSFFAGHLTGTTAITGALIVLVFYMLIGGRVYCAWVCPVNVVTDTADWLRRRLGILGGGARIHRTTRYWVLAMTLVLALVTGSIVWELVNPVSMLFRGLVFGMGFAWLFVLAVFLFDLLVSRKGWCGHLCPVGAFYSLVGQRSLVRVAAVRREQCDNCMDCFTICPEPQVIKPALKGAGKGFGPVILSSDCTNCGRCIDVCDRDVFDFTTRFCNDKGSRSTNHPEITP